MRLHVVRLALEDDANIDDVLATILTRVRVLRGAMIVGGDASKMFVGADSEEEGRQVAEFLSAPDGEGFRITPEDDPQ